MNTIQLALRVFFFLVISMTILFPNVAGGQQPVSLSVTLVDGSHILGGTDVGSLSLMDGEFSQLNIRTAVPKG